MFKSSAQSGIGLVSTLVIISALLGSLYFMNNKVQVTANLVGNIQKKSKNAYALKGIVAYAKDLLSSRVCINAAKETGLPTTPCRLTDQGSLERLLISRNVASSLCRYYTNNGKPLDGLQSYCEPNKPPLYLTTLNFNIKASKITTQHPLYILFDKNSDYSLLTVNCLNIRYDSSASSLHSSVAKVTTTVTAYVDAFCKGDIVSVGQSIDMFYPRQLSEFALISNRSLSVGSPSDSQANIISESSNVIFQSPIFLNKNLYVPETGSASTRNVFFQDRVFLAGEFKNLSSNHLTPKLVDNGDLWLSRLPSFIGLQKGLVRTKDEDSLSRMFDPSLTPVNITNLMNECNDYRERKSANSFCDNNIIPKLIFKKTATSKYTLGLTKQSEFVPKKINANTYNGLITYPSGKPSSAKVVLRLDNNYNVYLSPETTNGNVSINLVKLNKLELKNNVNCLSVSAPPRKICKDNNDNLEQTTPVNNPYSTQTVSIVKDTDSASEVFNNNDFVSKTISNCQVPPVAITNAASAAAASTTANNNLVTAQTNAAAAVAASNAAPADLALLAAKNNALNAAAAAAVAATTAANLASSTAATALIQKCDLTTTRFQLNKANLAAPKLTIKVTQKFTNSGLAAPQLFGIEINADAFDSAIFQYNNGNILNFQIKPFDFCVDDQFFDSIAINLSTSEFSSINNSAWSYPAGNAASLNSLETTYLAGTFSFLEKCNVVSLPSTAYASYDADWTLEAFNSWNFNPVDKVGQYKPHLAQTGYASIFNLSIPITNKLEIDNTNMNLFHSYSILDRCIIKSSATIVKGFLGCRYFVIEDRTLDLELIGSFIVDKMLIGQTANAKIYWKNIYHPSVRNKLVGYRQLKPTNQCIINPNDPTWAKLDDDCVPASLTVKAIPFTWTTFDPLCVISAVSPVAICKPEERAYNFNTIKIFEIFGM
ncbi:MAG: hypothetical protein HOP07_16650 [Bacteriovoracaceae bacterium]|nr:hypothetical protein [Bacteriovoracaceae bacterium]